MRILTLGDIVGTQTVDYLQGKLWELRRRERVDLVIANGENVSEIRGISARNAAELLDTGVDLITLGNHAWGKRDIYGVLENEARIIRPANYPAEAPGSGYTVLRADGWRILCINICGRVYMEPLASPFDTVDRILERERGAYDFAVMDIHAEATSEKLALAHYFDGRIAVMFGTHTHVPTADLQILPKGSGYVTDLGMCGPRDGIIGTDAQQVIRRFRTMMPTRFSVAGGEVKCDGVIFETDGSRLRRAKRITF